MAVKEPKRPAKNIQVVGMSESERRDLTKQVAIATADLGRTLTFAERAKLVRLVRAVLAHKADKNIFANGQSLQDALRQARFRFYF